MYKQTGAFVVKYCKTMNYQETLTYLYENVPMFQQVGKTAYKEGLENTCILDEYFNYPHRKFKTIHVGGTNGKGSCSHTLAAILQSAGYRTGLYTSPHLIDFRERIKINGIPVSEEYVVEFVEEYKSFYEPLSPSFFELTTSMAFKYFAEQQVDIAIIEVGMGGRLDCTNIIEPVLSIITNISLDHTQYLGDSLGKIAEEKAGIIKKNTPVIIGETTPETKPIFREKAIEKEAPIIFAEDEKLLISAESCKEGGFIYETKDYPQLYGELGGTYQLQNTNTILSVLRQLISKHYSLTDKDVREGFANVTRLTGLRGRWETISDNPKIICDTGHNQGGISYITKQLKNEKYRKLHIIIGMVNDKDIKSVLALLPRNADYYFTKADIKRALPEKELYELGKVAGLKGNYYPSVKEALKAAKANADTDDLIFVGGSTFIVADLLKEE